MKITVYVQDDIFLDVHAEARQSLPLEAYSYGLTCPGIQKSVDDFSLVHFLLRDIHICNVCSFIQASGNQL